MAVRKPEPLTKTQFLGGFRGDPGIQHKPRTLLTVMPLSFRMIPLIYKLHCIFQIVFKYGNSGEVSNSESREMGLSPTFDRCGN